MTARHASLAGSVVVLVSLAAGCGGNAAQTAPSSLDDLAKQSLATIDGELTVSGLKQPVDVIRDETGIPHIYAQNDDDLFFAQGYVMAQDRLWQMEMWRRWHEGRLAEIFGPKAFPYDARTRLLMFRGPWDAAEWTSYHPDAERLFTDYANGINAYIADHTDNLPVEFTLTGIRPDPWTAKTVVLRWAQLALSSARGHAINEMQLALNVAKYGVEEANRRTTPDPWDDLKVPDGLDVSIIPPDILTVMRDGDGDPFEPGALPPLEVLPQYRDLMPSVQVAHVLPEFQDEEGSNNWVVSGKLSATGIPLLSNDPHRRIEMPALRYFVHLTAPGWNVVGGGEPPFIGVQEGNNATMAWGLTFAGTDMVDVFVEETNPADASQTLYNGQWEPMRVITEDIAVKGEETPRKVELKFTRHGPVFYEDPAHHRAYAVKSVNQEPGTAPYLGSFKLAQATSCSDFFERAMYWKMPTHNLICGSADGNIAMMVTGLTPDRDGWNGRLPVPGTGKYEWRGFRSDLPREYNPARGYIATANNNTTQPEGYTGRPVFYHSSEGVDVSRITRINQLLSKGGPFSIEDFERFEHDTYSLRAEKDHHFFHGWTSKDPAVEKARAMIEGWDLHLTTDSVPGALYVRWTASESGRRVENAEQGTQAAIEEGLRQAIDRLTKDWGPDWTQWRYGRINASELPHMFVPAFDLPTIERPGGFNTVMATGANFRRIVDLSNPDNSVGSNAPGQSAQPDSPYYGNTRENLAENKYFPLVLTRPAVDKIAAHHLTLKP